VFGAGEVLSDRLVRLRDGLDLKAATLDGGSGERDAFCTPV
jgi:hypothetical protein